MESKKSKQPNEKLPERENRANHQMKNKLGERIEAESREEK